MRLAIAPTASLRSSGSVGSTCAMPSQARTASNSLAGIAAQAEQGQRHRPIEHAGVHVRQAEMLGQRPGDRPLAAGRGPSTAITS